MISCLQPPFIGNKSFNQTPLNNSTNYHTLQPIDFHIGIQSNKMNFDFKSYRIDNEAITFYF